VLNLRVSIAIGTRYVTAFEDSRPVCYVSTPCTPAVSTTDSLARQ
jgi:hypothetical protein